MPNTPTDNNIPGWFRRIDIRLFAAFLEAQEKPGDLVEIGVFMGKSAVLIGDYLREGEKFVAIDPFGDQSVLSDSPEDQQNVAENQHYYRTLSREQFEEHYLSVHAELPVVVQAKSSEITKHVDPGAARFIHVDGSHLYAAVAEDCRSAKQLLQPGGVVVYDDWRNNRCPGVAAAVWESVVRDGLIPVATTTKKLYGVYSDPETAVDVVRQLVAGDEEFFFSEDHEIMGHTVIRLESKRELAAEQAAKKARKERIAARQAGVQAPVAEPRRKWLGRR